jgi:hypothetical protein
MARHRRTVKPRIIASEVGREMSPQSYKGLVSRSSVHIEPRRTRRRSPPRSTPTPRER